ncbi:MAG: molybdopterin molybdotransferase MoeA [Methanomicrobiales archaeon]|mgnify:CR=1 FL=1|nr:molybdopterin molybdotransferase MoeA [Methanomicrobiales archaeon]
MNIHYKTHPAIHPEPSIMPGPLSSDINDNDTDTSPLYSASVKDAVTLIRSIAPDTRIETRFIDESDGYTLAAPVVCREDMPGYCRSSKDGFAVHSHDILKATFENPVRLKYNGKIRSGYSEKQRIEKGECFAITTGGPVPEGADAVVMHEHAILKGKSVEVTCPAVHGENVISKDEDAKAGEIIYPEGWVIRPQDIGVLAGFGICTVQVRAMPVIGILSTGPELVPADGRPLRGEIRETNSYLISALCRKFGAVPKRYGIAWDGSDQLSHLLMIAVAECDAVIISGGSAHDERDRTAEVISGQGKLLLSGLSISPRKTMVIGEIQGKPIIGLPGHPASVYLLLLLVVTSLIQAMKGADAQGLIKEQVIAGVDIKGHPDREYHIPVRISDDKAYPLGRKAGMISILSQCDGIIHIPQGSTGIKKGEMAEMLDLTCIRSPVIQFRNQ